MSKDDARQHRKTVKEVTRAIDRHYQEWMDSPVRKSLIASFYVSFCVFVGALIFYGMPLETQNDSTLCSDSTTQTVVEGAAPSTTTEHNTSCGRRGVPSWILVAGPIVSGIPIAALVALRPGRAKVTGKTPDGQEYEAEVVDAYTALGIAEAAFARVRAKKDTYDRVNSPERTPPDS